MVPVEAVSRCDIRTADGMPAEPAKALIFEARAASNCGR